MRKPGEYNAAHLEDVENVPLDFLNENMNKIPTDQKVYLHCAGGYRSMIAASILKARGYHQIEDVIGGFSKIKNTNLPIVTQECQKNK